MFFNYFSITVAADEQYYYFYSNQDLRDKT